MLLLICQEVLVHSPEVAPAPTMGDEYYSLYPTDVDVACQASLSVIRKAGERIQQHRAWQGVT